MAVAQAIPAARRRMTEEEFLRLPDDGRKWELVDGEAREVPAGHEHDVMVMSIGAMLKPFARKEFGLSGREYGLLAEGDPGTLTFQGTRYKGFARSAA